MSKWDTTGLDENKKPRLVGWVPVGGFPVQGSNEGLPAEGWGGCGAAGAGLCGPQGRGGLGVGRSS